MNNIDDGNGKKESRVKLVREENIGEYAYSSKGTTAQSNFGESELKDILNNGIYWNRMSGKCPAYLDG